MKMRMTLLLTSMLVVFCLVHEAYPFDHSSFDLILKEYVDDRGLVDYNGIARDRRFSEYMKSLESAKVDELSPDGRLAFWINAYNAVTIDKVIKKKPKKSVRETLIPSLWTSTKFFSTRDHIVAGERVSQDDIEHEILRKKFKDPRIHFAIVCASRGCPPLPRSAYTEENVQARLEEETRRYLNSERGIRIDRAENTVYVSKIFDWFREDFVEESGSVIDFIHPYPEEEIAAFLDQKPKVEFLDYDWALNAKEPLK